MPCAPGEQKAAAGRPAELGRRRLLAALAAAAAVAAGLPHPLWAQPFRLFRIGTGGVAGTYYPVGTLIAGVIGQPPGARPCERGGSCGVPGLIAVVQSSNGSVANIEAILAGELESGFAQADVAWWAYHGEGPFAGRPPATELRAIAKLYDESVHLVVSADSGIEHVRALAGRRISLDEEGSGTLVDARLILAVFGLSEADLRPVYVKADEAVTMMRQRQLDGFFIVAGYPTASVTEAVGELGARLVPIAGPEIAGLIRRWPFFSYEVIPSAVYPGQPAVETIGVGALWVVHERLDEELVYGITRALFHPVSRNLLDSGHPMASKIRPKNAIKGVSIPLHPGAGRWYREQGLLP